MNTPGTTPPPGAQGDRSVTYLQCLYPHEPLAGKSGRDAAVVSARSAAASRIHPLQNGHVTCSGLPVVRYKDPNRLNEIIGFTSSARYISPTAHVFTARWQPLQARPTRINWDSSMRSIRTACSIPARCGKLAKNGAMMRVLYVYCHPLDDSVMPRS